ncbi:hypothetical protein SAMD00019534_019940 [Acytostelium subglobosum LB1]|uniref:hypothetical protein n=1 Tax=Acytostelium subglobosum LB1 TaxID=1410327 RepID=UPI000644FDF7|nr:hypothetical protein SAMD00019534_019940 [Acytostelium subglobosum LB1]GAM18819.1 hypothetical protein SAMD00019534_019940 [Acytostelium subglobosum LB1]|eukprot:XP_012758039.1 hypothetical protein SAMD00019534_019940 [Acytostelium subglobosum LB1]
MSETTPEELPSFDLTQKKKKKTTSSSSTGEEKKKKSTKVTEPVEEEVVEKKKKSSSKKSKDESPAQEDEDTVDFNSLKKKKKSSSSKKSSKDEVEEEAPAAAEGDEDSANVMDLGKKKKKSSSKSKEEKEEAAEKEAAAMAAELESENITGTPWVGSDRDYRYAELTYRVYHLLQANNPELMTDQKRAMKTPTVFRDGSRKTVWANFSEICQILNRKPEHVLSYVFTELGTNGSVDGNHRLVVKGRFTSQQMEVVIRHYISEYVACRNCKSPNTVLERTNRLYFLSCNVCNSKRSVVVIKKGLEVGKNKAKEGPTPS